MIAVTASLTVLAAACGSDGTPATRPSAAGSDTTGAPRTTTATAAETTEPTETAQRETTDVETTDVETTDVETTDVETTDVETTERATPTPSGAIHSIDEARAGAIQIIAQGSIRDPEIGTYASGSSGSGFFVSPDGYAVTNNHVVTGAATLEVYIGGDTSDSFNAQVVGVSECNDLALIKVDTDEVPYFEWYDEPAQAGLDVFTAGFPLGDPEFTLTKGIVSKAEAGGDLTGTSSIDHTIEHDASIQPGNSGGALLDSDARVVGVNYAGGARDLGAQYYAISADLAEGVVDELHDGDFESLGVNGFAVTDEASGITGIWVAGVGAGTPAAEVGLSPGDIITSMNGLPVGSDGTFKDYCDVIRTAGSKPISVQVLRFDTNEVLEGEINGDQPLTTTISFAEDVSTENGVAEGESYTDYVTVTDDTGTLTLEVPAEWADVATAPLDNEGQTLPRIEAATDVARFNSTFDVPGVKFIAVHAAGANLQDLLFGFGVEGCTDAGISDYDDGVFVGQYQLYEDCAGSDAVYVVLVSQLVNDPGTFYVTTVQAVTSSDLEVLDHILRTFNAAA